MLRVPYPLVTLIPTLLLLASYLQPAHVGLRAKEGYTPVAASPSRSSSAASGDPQLL